MTKQQQSERDDARATLREWLKPGDTVFTVLRHVSRSGMSRDVSVVVFRDGQTTNDAHPNYLVAKACGYRLKRGGMHDALVVGGCGFDAGYDIVHSLSHALWPDGFGCIGEGCPSNDHSNGDRDYTPHGTKEKGAWSHMPNTLGGPVMLTCRDCLELVNAEGQDKTHGCPKHSHWHQSGGDALRHRWL